MKGSAVPDPVPGEGGTAASLIHPSSPFGLLMGAQVEVVGIEDVDGALRVFINHRADGIYVVIGPEDPTEQEAIRLAWANTHSRLLIPAPTIEQVHRVA